MASATTVSLSRNDRAVLGALFDPEDALQRSCQIDPTSSDSYDETTMTIIRGQESDAVRLINEQTPSSTNIHAAIRQLSQVTTKYPLYSSAFNNRAQATRMLFDLAEARSHPMEVRSVFSDLTRAIELASPRTTDAVSAANAKVLASACTHRGYVLWRASRPEAPVGLLDSIEHLSGLDKEKLEELASRDLTLGGRYGNQDAQKLAVICNPYAKLCGSIVREALQNDIKEWQQSQVA